MQEVRRTSSPSSLDNSFSSNRQTARFRRATLWKTQLTARIAVSAFGAGPAASEGVDGPELMTSGVAGATAPGGWSAAPTDAAALRADRPNR